MLTMDILMVAMTSLSLQLIVLMQVISTYVVSAVLPFVAG